MQWQWQAKRWKICFCSVLSIKTKREIFSTIHSDASCMLLDRPHFVFHKEEHGFKNQIASHFSFAVLQ